jgi:hypothetical protein
MESTTIRPNNFEPPQRTTVVNNLTQTLVIQADPERRGWIIINPIADTIYWSTKQGWLGAPILAGGAAWNDAGQLVDTTEEIWVITESAVGTIGISEHFQPIQNRNRGGLD